MRAAIKTILLFLSIFLCMVALAFFRSIFIFLPEKRRWFSSYIVHIFGKIFTFILGIKVNIPQKKDLFKKRGVFFVGNHLSYIEGIVATSLSPLVFIAKADLRNWPFFGIFTFLSDTIFINRQNPSNIKREIDRIVSFLTNKVNVILFPEGTSTDGGALLPFKSSFFAAPLEAECLIIPLVISYKKINSKRVNEKNKDLVYWYGTMEFFPHLLNLLKLREVVIEVNVCEPLRALQIKDKKISFQRKNLRDACWEMIKNRVSGLDLGESIKYFG